jgi:hypothetical protein
MPSGPATSTAFPRVVAPLEARLGAPGRARAGTPTLECPRARGATAARSAPSTALTLLAVGAACLTGGGCGQASAAGAAPAGGTVVVASGADLESANPLVTVHPMARQVQRFALFVTLARYDSALRPDPLLRAGVALVGRPPHHHPVARSDAPLARRPGDHGARRRLHARCRPRSGDGVAARGRSRVARARGRRGRYDAAARGAAAARRPPVDSLRAPHPAGASTRHRAPRGLPARSFRHGAVRQRPLSLSRAACRRAMDLRSQRRLSRYDGRAAHALAGSSSPWWTSRPPSSQGW